MESWQWSLPTKMPAIIAHLLVGTLPEALHLATLAETEGQIGEELGVNTLPNLAGVRHVQSSVDVPNEIGWHRADRSIPQESTATTGHEHRANLNRKVVVDSPPDPVLEEGNAVVARPHVSGNVAPEVIDDGPVGR